MAIPVCEAHNPPRCRANIPFDVRIDCRVCWWGIEDGSRIERDGNPCKKKFHRFKPVSLPCVHLGEEFPALWNSLANVSTAKRYFECEKGHGPQCRCDGKCGPACVDYEPELVELEIKRSSVSRRRHLAFHIYPAVGNTVWRRSIEQIRQRWHLFDGYKAVAVCTADHLLPFATVADAFMGMGADVFQVENDGGLREVKTWQPLWDRVLANASDSDVAFYAHAKGVTRENSPGCMTHRWASLLFHLNLDFWPNVEKMLTRTPIVGAFKKTGYGFGRHQGRFHYSGTFYWLRIDDFRQRYNASKPPQVWFGTECWPGMAYDVGEAGCVWGENVQSKLNLYAPSYWRDVVYPGMAEWILQRNAG